MRFYLLTILTHLTYLPTYLLTVESTALRFYLLTILTHLTYLPTYLLTVESTALRSSIEMVST